MNEKALKIINNYGINKQIKYFQSEIFELNEAIIEYEMCKKYAPNYSVPDEWYEKLRKHIAEEIGDVMVMLTEFKEYYQTNTDEIKDIMEFKIDRQLDRIEEENGKIQRINVETR